MVQLDARQRAQGLPKLESLTVHPAKSDRENCANAKGNKVVEHSACGAGLSSNIDYITDREAGFDGGFCL
jgi:hypothetical protein